LIWSFIHGEHRSSVELIDAVPSRCGEMLEQREVDAALVPIIEYQRLENLLIVPDVCVGTRERVRSVVLASQKANLRDVKSVALDESSRTSATLIKILFKEFVGVEPQWIPRAPRLSEMLSSNDAALIIGDPAMTFPRDGIHVFDLATLWHEYTGLGFVFAMWMTQKENAERIAEIDFRRARDHGLENIGNIVREYRKLIPLSVEELTEYLTENISYRIDDSMWAGLQRYFELAHKHGLIQRATSLSFVAQ
jgi:chorismate dehydratase